MRLFSVIKREFTTFLAKTEAGRWEALQANPQVAQLSGNNAPAKLLRHSLAPKEFLTLQTTCRLFAYDSNNARLTAAARSVVRAQAGAMRIYLTGSFSDRRQLMLAAVGEGLADKPLQGISTIGIDCREATVNLGLVEFKAKISYLFTKSPDTASAYRRKDVVIFAYDAADINTLRAVASELRNYRQCGYGESNTSVVLLAVNAANADASVQTAARTLASQANVDLVLSIQAPIDASVSQALAAEMQAVVRQIVEHKHGRVARAYNDLVLLDGNNAGTVSSSSSSSSSTSTSRPG